MCVDRSMAHEIIRQIIGNHPRRCRVTCSEMGALKRADALDETAAQRIQVKREECKKVKLEEQNRNLVSVNFQKGRGPSIQENNSTL